MLMGMKPAYGDVTRVQVACRTANKVTDFPAYIVTAGSESNYSPSSYG